MAFAAWCKENSRMKPLPIWTTALGPLRTFRSTCVGGLPTYRVPPRRAGNFHLLVQMKVTKANDLSATPLMRSARCGTPARRATWRQRDPSNSQRTGRRGPRKASPAQIRWTQGQSEARPRRASCRIDQRRCVQVARRAGLPQREERAEWFCIGPLCFGDFHLGPQMKVTRPPGRDPAGNADRSGSPRQDRPNVRNAPRADHRSAGKLAVPRVSHPVRGSS